LPLQQRLHLHLAAAAAAARLHRWYGYIKDYDGGTLMECSMQPHVPYATLPQTFRAQRAALEELLKTLTTNHVVLPGLQRMGPGYPGGCRAPAEPARQAPRLAPSSAARPSAPPTSPAAAPPRHPAAGPGAKGRAGQDPAAGIIALADIPGVDAAGWTPARHPPPNFKLLLSTGATYDAGSQEGLHKWVAAGLA
jgi:hypothetical protein